MSAANVSRAGQARVIGPVSDSDQLTAAEVGGKALGLSKLLAAGFSVPRFWIVPASTLSGLATRGLRQLVAKMDGLVATDAAAFADLARQFHALILDPRIEKRLRCALESDLPGPPASKALYAVRSSAVGEDSAQASYAGQLDSFLNVPAAGLVAAILKVWASAYSARALAYRERKALGRRSVATAVIIQDMVPAVRSGVLFTRHPESDEPGYVICAGFGLGEGIVADRVPSDTYRVDYQSGQIERHIVEKGARVVLDTRACQGTQIETVPTWLRHLAALTDAQILELRDVGVRAERALGGPQDIEWALDASGRLLLLQARPIVRAARAANRGAPRLWDNSNIAESYPGITLPLTFSFARQCYEAAFSGYMQRRALDYGPCGRPFRAHRHLLRNMIGLLNGRVYYNLTTWYELMSFLPGFRWVKASWDRMVGVAEAIDCSSRRMNRLHAVLAWGWCVWKLLTVRRTAQRFVAHFDAVYPRFANLALESATADELVDVYQRLAHQLGDKWSLTLDNDFSAMAYYAGLGVLCRRWLPTTHAGLYNDLLCGERDMESVRPLRALAALAAAVSSDAAMLELLRAKEDAQVWKAIQTCERVAGLKRAIEEYLCEYGDRSAEDLKLERVGFRERPELLVAAIRRQLEAGVAYEAIEAREREIRAHAQAELQRLLRNPCKRIAMRFVLNRARFAIMSREHMRFARTRLFGVVRRLFRQLGERLAEQGMIPAPADIHYLTVDEVLSVVEGASVTQNLAGLIALRKADFSGFAAQTPADRVWTRGSPYACDLAGAPVKGAGGESALGTPCARGLARGSARVIHNPAQSLPAGSHILIARSTDPGWVFLMTQARGLIVEKGSVLSHTAIIGRELGIPTIVGVKDATLRIPDGARICMDGGTGRIVWESERLLSIAS